LGLIEIYEGKVGETEQQSGRELEQLDVWDEANVNPLPDKLSSSKAWEKGGHKEGSGLAMAEWGWGTDREKAEEYVGEDWFSYSGGVVQSYPGRIQCSVNEQLMFSCEACNRDV